MPDRWAVGEEGGAYRGDAAVKSNRITASKPMARKMRKPANNPPGATECSRTWPPWTTLTPLRQPPTGRSGARCGHCPVERVGASLEGKLLS